MCDDQDNRDQDPEWHHLINSDKKTSRAGTERRRKFQQTTQLMQTLTRQFSENNPIQWKTAPN